MISKRSRLVDSSGIRKVFDLAASLEDPINLSIGQPHFDVPESIRAALIGAVKSGKNKYTQTQGIEQLRHKVLEKEKKRTGIEHDSVMITSGVSGGLVLAMMALLDPGDEVIIPDPYFVMYKHLAMLFGGVPRYVDTYPDFEPTAERIEEVLSPRSKLLFINSPANPTGKVLGRDRLMEIADLAGRHNLLVISDEIYHEFCYDGEAESIAAHCPQTLLLNGLSKSSAMTGWRLGWAVGPEDVIQEMMKLQQYTFVCAPAMVQEAALVALDLDTAKYKSDYRAKRDRLMSALSGSYEIDTPEGAFYMFPRAPGDGGMAFVERAIQHGLLVVPGGVFSQRDTNFRLSYAASDETIERGIEVLLRIAR